MRVAGNARCLVKTGEILIKIGSKTRGSGNVRAFLRYKVVERKAIAFGYPDNQDGR
jgi:hypothetical protein